MLLPQPKVSSCCGANEQSEGYYSVEGGYCPECKCHCEFVDASVYFEDGTVGFVDHQGIIRCLHIDTRTESGDCACGCRDIQVCSECGEEQEMAVNALIGRDERPSFQPSTAELAMFLIFFFLCLGLSLHTVMKGDRAAMNGMALPRVESGVGNER